MSTQILTHLSFPSFHVTVLLPLHILMSMESVNVKQGWFLFQSFRCMRRLTRDIQIVAVHVSLAHSAEFLRNSTVIF
jgi:hypothetical protein